MKKIWIATKDTSACTYYRCQAPAQFCNSEEIQIETGTGLDLTKGYDAIIIHGVCQAKWIQVFKEIQSHNIKIAINLDDDIFNIPDWNPAFISYKETEKDNLAWTLENADLIIVSTEPLANVCKEYMTENQDKVRVCPNLMDWTLYKRYPRQVGPTRILWAGSVHHEMDLKLIAEPLEQIIKEFKDAVEVTFMGCLPDKFRDWQPLLGSNMAIAVPKGGARYVKPVDLEHYPSTLCKLQPDIALCPLTNCKFNYSKSYTKAGEYMLAGASVVASPLPPYNVLGDAILYADDWYEGIKKAMSHQFKNGYDEIRKNWCWNGPKKELWENAFKELTYK